MARGEYAVKVQGLAELRRDLRRLEPAAAKQVQQVLKAGADIVAREAALLAPRRTGALAESYRPFTSGNKAGVRSRLPYAGVVEYGGTIRPRGVDIQFKRSEPVTRAVLRNTDRIVRELDAGMTRAFGSTGF